MCYRILCHLLVPQSNFSTMSRSLAEIAFSNIPDERVEDPRARAVIENMAYNFNEQRCILNFDKDIYFKNIKRLKNEYLDMFYDEVDVTMLKRFHDSYKAIIEIRDNDWTESDSFGENWVWWDWTMSYVVLEIPQYCQYDTLYCLLETMVQRWEKYGCNEKPAYGEFGISIKNYYYNHVLPAYKKYTPNFHNYEQHIEKMNEVNSAHCKYWECSNDYDFYTNMVYKASRVLNSYSPPSEADSNDFELTVDLDTALDADGIQMEFQFLFPPEQA